MENIETKVKKCTVRLHHQESRHDGTGFFVAPHFILTCAHVVKTAEEKGQSIYGVTSDKEKLELNLIYCSENSAKLDLALLEIKDKNKKFSFLKLDKEVQSKDNLYSYGYPEKYPDGDTNTFEYIGFDGKNLLKFKLGNVKPGWSGSPLLNTRTNKVCGMIIRTLDRNIDLGGRAVSANTILDNLPQLNKYQKSVINPFQPLHGTIESKLLLARENQINRVFEILNSNGNVAIIGESGTGKTSLLKLIEEQVKFKLSDKRKPIIFNLAGISNDEECYQAMCDLIGINPPLKDYFFKRELIKNHRILLLIDVVEQMTEGFTASLRKQLRSLANDTDCLRLVIAANQPLNNLFSDSGMTSPFEGICLEVQLSPWDEITIKEFINNRLAETDVNFAEADIQCLIEESKGNPRTLMQKCHEMYQKYQEL